MRIAANAQIAGCWQGRQLGVISFPLEAAKARGVISDSAFALHDGWGLNSAAAAWRIIRAINDARSSPSSFHMLAWGLGARPAKMIGAHTATSLGWILNYLFSFARQPPIEYEHHLELPPSSCD